ncbi:sushi domain-containing protein [Caerostris darwini]|uniref:Sushi domain-containing protein n=1 Tax=Caerostris darwini TaxID=1538125 RepID=A0AAV4T645_9ARAC|nr:sushi domain-containing protein [Caerostris darwini]
MFKAQKYFAQIFLQTSSPKYLTCLILFIHFLFCNTCQPPDYPEGGSYTPVKKKYLLGDKIVYSCKDKLARLGNETSICQTTGKWSGPTPFCDSPTRVRNPTASSDPNREVSNTVDGSPNSCYHSDKGTGHSLKVYLDPPAAVNLIRIYLKKGKALFKVSIIQSRHLRITSCSTFERELGKFLL